MKNNFLFMAAATLIAFSSSAAESNSQTEQNLPSQQIRQPSEFQKVIDEYRGYIATIPAETRQEIVEYRKGVARLNKEKISLYKKLSQTAQEYLKKEKMYKKRLPADQRKMMLKGAMSSEEKAK